MQSRRGHVSEAELNGFIYAMGSYDENNRRNIAEPYNPQAKLFIMVAVINVQRSVLFTTFLILSVALAAVALDMPDIIEGPTTTPLGCHRRLYTYRVTQVDAEGRECWDHISVMSCWGRCDSSEISDWKFPYKRSYHPVCVHASRSKAVATLRNCHPQADPETRRYEYMEAVSCHCHTCSTSDTSCEAPSQVRDETSIKVLALAGPDPDDLEY